MNDVLVAYENLNNLTRTIETLHDGDRLVKTRNHFKLLSGSDENIGDWSNYPERQIWYKECNTAATRFTETKPALAELPTMQYAKRARLLTSMRARYFERHLNVDSSYDDTEIGKTFAVVIEFKVG